MSKVVSMEQAVSMIKSGSTVVTSGFLIAGTADGVIDAVSRSFDRSGTPNDLTIMYAAGQGDKAGGLHERWAKKGLVRRWIGGHFGFCPKFVDMINNNEAEAYNLPLGVIVEMYRAMGQGKKGYMTNVGLETFVDPRLEGGKLNAVTTEDIVKVVQVEGEELLYYKLPKVDVAIIRATTADTNGNCTIEDEILPMDMLTAAMAAKGCGGKVIVQVKHVVQADTIPSRQVAVPGIFVDAVVVADQPEVYHRQCLDYFVNPALAGACKVPADSVGVEPFGTKKFIGRRCAMELIPHAVVNLGAGIPEKVALVAEEEGLSDQLILTTESGMIGGIPSGGGSFGAGINGWAELPEVSQFDFYDGGGLDVTYLGLAECDRYGNVNVSKFGKTIAGCGGFINISQNTKDCIFCGAFTAGGLKTDARDGKLIIVEEGKKKKFVADVQQVTFSGNYARKHQMNVMFITERAVFRLLPEGLTLTEIAPGIDLKTQILDQMGFQPRIAEDLKLMDQRIFTDAPMSIRDEILAKSGTSGTDLEPIF